MNAMQKKLTLRKSHAKYDPDTAEHKQLCSYYLMNYVDKRANACESATQIEYIQRFHYDWHDSQIVVRLVYARVSEWYLKQGQHQRKHEKYLERIE